MTEDDKGKCGSHGFGQAMKAVVVLSGPASGLGRELLTALLASCVPTIAVGRRLDRLAGEFPAASGLLVMIDVDLADLLKPGATENLDHHLGQALDKADADSIVLLNNAGVISPIGRVGDVAPGALHDALSVNLLAPMVLTTACARHARSLGGGLVVMNISSGAALRPLPGWSAYCATKAATRMYFEVLAVESPAFEVHQIDPGAMDTAMQETIRASSPEQFPLVEHFSALKEEGRLKPSAVVAAEIVERILARTRQ